MEEISFKYEYSFDTKENSETELYVKRKQGPLFNMTIQIPKNYPLVQPKLKFELLSKQYESTLQDNTYSYCYNYVQGGWRANIKLVDVIEQAEEIIYHSLLKQSRLFFILKMTCIMLNLIFIGVVLMDKDNALLNIVDSKQKNAVYPIYEIIKKSEKFLARMLPSHHGHPGLHKGFDQMNFGLNLLTEHYIFSALYLTVMVVYFYLTISENQLRLKSWYFYFYLCVIAVNPITLTIILNNHIQNLSYMLLVITLIFLSLKEYELSVLSFFASYCFNSNIIKLSFIEMIIIFVLEFVIIGKRAYLLRNKLINAGRAVWLICLFVGLNFIIYMELESDAFSMFFLSILNNIKLNIWFSCVTAIAITPLIYLAYIRKEIRDEFYMDYISLLLLLNHVLHDSEVSYPQHNFAMFLSNTVIIAHKTNMVNFCVLVPKIIITIFSLEKHIIIIGITFFAQMVNLLVFSYRNMLYLSRNKVDVIEVGKLSVRERFCQMCYLLVNSYWRIFINVVFVFYLVSVIGQIHILADLVLIVYIGVINPCAMIFVEEHKKMKSK